MKRPAFWISFFILTIIGFQMEAQEKQYAVTCIGFYNLENLFDTLESDDTWDTEFTPNGRNNWDGPKYREKLKNLAKVVSELGTELTPHGVSLLGVSEIENRSVLEDLVKEDAIADRNYQIVHFESPDFRGIDVALLYNPAYFTPTKERNIPVPLINSSGDTSSTRDILYIQGNLDGEPVYIFVNHWPSRRGGEKASRPKRNYCASIVRRISDSLRTADPQAKIIVMGDLNDDPVSPSVKRVMSAHGNKEKVGHDEFYNPMLDPFKKGIGTLAWRDAWNVFDQILISRGLVDKETPGFTFYRAVIYNKRYLVQKSGRYQGYPYRTYSGGVYTGGYSDHFPVFMYLVKEISRTR